MKINNLTFDEIISYGELGEISLSTPEDFEYLDELEDNAFRRGSDESADSYDEGHDLGYAEGLVAND